jgi:hypothetical protein
MSRKHGCVPALVSSANCEPLLALQRWVNGPGKFEQHEYSLRGEQRHTCSRSRRVASGLIKRGKDTKPGECLNPTFSPRWMNMRLGWIQENEKGGRLADCFGYKKNPGLVLTLTACRTALGARRQWKAGERDRTTCRSPGFGEMEVRPSQTERIGKLLPRVIHESVIQNVEFKG